MSDASGYHKLVRITGEHGYQEPPVTGGSDADTATHVGFMRTRYTLEGLSITVGAQGRGAYVRDATTAECMPLYPVEAILDTIARRTVVDIGDYRERRRREVAPLGRATISGHARSTVHVVMT